MNCASDFKKIDQFSAQIGELLQHSINVDPKILETSDWYYDFIKGVLNRHLAATGRTPIRYLEIASYRHVIGYRLAKEMGFDATQFDISYDDLEEGRKLALRAGYGDACTRVAGDFHDLPFADNFFDFVFISASIHHSKTPDRVISEAMRVLSDGGLFYSQREPCRRLFCFYKFTCNRQDSYTLFEKHLAQRDMLRVFSSPFPGARNAVVFGRVENDLIPLQFYFDTFALYGEILEEVVYHEGLLTAIDKKILEHDYLSVDELECYIVDLLRYEIDLAAPLISKRDKLLGYALPDEQEIMSLAKSVAHALKNRPANTRSVEWRRAMANIFGGSLRFVVKRKCNNKISNNIIFRRNPMQLGECFVDDLVYGQSGLQIWNKLLPDIQLATAAEMHSSAFPENSWAYVRHTNGVAQMISRGSRCEIILNNNELVLTVMRYRVVLDEEITAVYLQILVDDSLVHETLIPQLEDRCLSLVLKQSDACLNIKLLSLDRQSVEIGSRIRVSVLQCIPLYEYI